MFIHHLLIHFIRVQFPLPDLIYLIKKFPRVQQVTVPTRHIRLNQTLRFIHHILRRWPEFLIHTLQLFFPPYLSKHLGGALLRLLITLYTHEVGQVGDLLCLHGVLLGNATLGLLRAADLATWLSWCDETRGGLCRRQLLADWNSIANLLCLTSLQQFLRTVVARHVSARGRGFTSTRYRIDPILLCLAIAGKGIGRGDDL